MKSFTSTFLSTLILSSLLIATQNVEAEQASRPLPADIRIAQDIQVDNWRVLDIFLYLLRGTGLQGGFVEIAACSGLPKGHLQIKGGGTVQQAMDALVAANPGYRWELKDGVVNLMPRAGAPLLQTRIATFRKDATDREIEAVLQDVLRLPEVKQREASLGLRQGISGGGLSGGEEHPVPRQPLRVQFALENLPLQDAFNKIIKESPNGVWIYHESDCNGAKSFIVELASD